MAKGSRGGGGGGAAAGLTVSKGTKYGGSLMYAVDGTPPGTGAAMTYAPGKGVSYTVSTPGYRQTKTAKTIKDALIDIDKMTKAYRKKS